VGKGFRHKVLATVSTQVMIFQKSSFKYFCMWQTISKCFFLPIYSLSLKDKSGAWLIIILVLYFIKCCTNSWTVTSTKIISINQFLYLAFAMQTIGSRRDPTMGHNTRFGNPCSRIWCYVAWDMVSSGIVVTTYRTIRITTEMLVITCRIMCIIKQKC